jgi:hypothetical protein
MLSFFCDLQGNTGTAAFPLGAVGEANCSISPHATLEIGCTHSAAWRDVWPGAAASLVVLPIWVYYSSQLVLMGAEFTRAYARRPSSRTHVLFSAVRRDHTNIDR